MSTGQAGLEGTGAIFGQTQQTAAVIAFLVRAMTQDFYQLPEQLVPSTGMGLYLILQVLGNSQTLSQQVTTERRG